MATLPPPPINDNQAGFGWIDWQRQVRDSITGTEGQIKWDDIDFTGSDINDIQAKNHNILQGLQGGKSQEYYHLTQAQYNSLGTGDHNSLNNLQGGITTERYHLTEPQYNWVVAGGSGDSYLPLAGGIMTGPINWLVNTGVGQVSVVPDVDYGGQMMQIQSVDGLTLNSPYILLESGNVIMSMPGAQQGSNVVVAGIDGAGNAQLGYAAPPTPGYTVSDTHDANIIIKAAGTAPPTAWVPLGLTVTLTQAVAANSATLSFDVELQNTTIHTGVVEFGMRVNGVDLFRDVTLQIPANYQSSVIISIPLINAYSSGDVITLIARVISNNNNQFALTMLASPTNLAVMRFQTQGTGYTLPIASASVLGGIKVGTNLAINSTTGVLDVTATPSGMVSDFAFATPPSGWLLCNGAAVSRTTYSALFAAVGTTWGAGDGSTTFNLPSVEYYTQDLYKTGSGGTGTATTITCIKT